MLKLGFNERVWLGFGTIILLISISSSFSLYSLKVINDSTEAVNQVAVPVQKQSNEVQIQLLKQAKLSALAYNAKNESQIATFKTEYQFGAEKFESMYNTLVELASQDETMSQVTTEAKSHYDNYVNHVQAMFDAKSQILREKLAANEETKELTLLVDDAGAILLDLSYLPVETDKEQEIIDAFAGEASRIDGQLIGFINVFKEINNQIDLEVLKKAEEDLEYAFSGMQPRIDFAAQSISQINHEGMWDTFIESIEAIKERTKASNENNLVKIKIRQIEQTEAARQKLDDSEASVTKVVAQFDQLLQATESQFNLLQSDVLSNVSSGLTRTIITWIVLILLATQNFNSMRRSIAKKMADLAKINSTGQKLASINDREVSLEEVLKVMHEQTGVDQGSVYMLNKHDELEVKAFYPPKKIDDGNIPRKFQIGEGALGQAAETKRILFISNTHQDSNFAPTKGDDRPPRALLCVPLVDQDVLVGVMNFHGDVSKVKFEDSDYSFASSMARTLVSKINNIRQREVIEEQNRTLEQKVEERTAQLQQKNRDIAVMLENMSQGLFTITMEGVIHHEYAAFLEEIFETKRIAQRNYSDLLLTDTSLGADTIDQIQTAIDSMMGMDEMMWEFNSHLLATEMVKSMPDGREKILEMDWEPIFDANEEISKIMVTVRDVTELKALQREAEAQKQELEVIGQILALTEAKYIDFISSSIKFIDECRALIEQTEDKNPEVVATLFRNMHTVKGNARTLGFTHITDSVHEVENTYDELRKIEDKQWDKEALLAELAHANESVKRYLDIGRDKLGRSPDATSNDSQFDQDQVNQLLQTSKSFDLSSLPVEASQWIREVSTMFLSAEGATIDKVIDEVIDSAYALADELEKPRPVVNIKHGDMLIKNEAHSMLNNIFMHVIRNAMDHGIEAGDERVAKGKTAEGHINLTSKVNGDQLELAVNDDGRGIAITKIFEMAIEKGMYAEGAARPPAHEIANLIFSSGFSTAEAVTEVSGRGVGMDAVKQFLESEGGGIELVLMDGDEQDDFRQFTTYIRLPSRFYMASPFAESA
jgi:two-component system, chemotaxis family, sensor kinase CheA